MPIAVIYWLNKTGLAEGQHSLLNFYYLKGNTVGDENKNISVVEKVPYITGVDYDTYDQNEYDIKHE